MKKRFTLIELLAVILILGINKVIELIPDRINLSVGTIQTSIDKTTINITSAQSKNWNIA